MKFSSIIAATILFIGASEAGWSRNYRSSWCSAGACNTACKNEHYGSAYGECRSYNWENRCYCVRTVSAGERYFY